MITPGEHRIEGRLVAIYAADVAESALSPSAWSCRSPLR